jgi:hypothetical protein
MPLSHSHKSLNQKRSHAERSSLIGQHKGKDVNALGNVPKLIFLC